MGKLIVQQNLLCYLLTWQICLFMFSSLWLDVCLYGCRELLFLLRNRITTYSFLSEFQFWPRKILLSHQNLSAGRETRLCWVSHDHQLQGCRGALGYCPAKRWYSFITVCKYICVPCGGKGSAVKSMGGFSAITHLQSRKLMSLFHMQYNQHRYFNEQHLPRWEDVWSNHSGLCVCVRSDSSWRTHWAANRRLQRTEETGRGKAAAGRYSSFYW